MARLNKEDKLKLQEIILFAVEKFELFQKYLDNNSEIKMNIKDLFDLYLKL